jgi:hypothetical protein
MLMLLLFFWAVTLCGLIQRSISYPSSGFKTETVCFSETPNKSWIQYLAPSPHGIATQKNNTDNKQCVFNLGR